MARAKAVAKEPAKSKSGTPSKSAAKSRPAAKREAATKPGAKSAVVAKPAAKRARPKFELPDEPVHVAAAAWAFREAEPASVPLVRGELVTTGPRPLSPGPLQKPPRAGFPVSVPTSTLVPMAVFGPMVVGAGMIAAATVLAVGAITMPWKVARGLMQLGRN